MKLESNEPLIPDHLFISYASEDWILADWLALKLASEGYKVWYDRIKLLGGESYPRDITAAIKNQTFRVLALLSRNSIEKPNPVKERTLALNIAKERKVDFLIPINVDGLRATELDFMMSDLTFISFDKSWFIGICALLKKLQQIHAPKNQSKGQQVISEWLSTEEQPRTRTEVVWSNLIPVLEIPTLIRKYKVVPEIDLESVYPNWPFVRDGEDTLWAFCPPEKSNVEWLKEIDQVDLRNLKYYSGGIVRNILTTLLHLSIELKCINKGLKFRNGFLHFPDNLIPNNILHFTRYDGRRSYVKVVGERKFRVTQEGNTFSEKSRYHLSPDLRFFADLFGSPTIRLRMSVFWTDTADIYLEAQKANRRRKALCRNWWNNEWLSRSMAILQWLGMGDAETTRSEGITILRTDAGDFRIGSKPISFSSNVGIYEKIVPTDEPEDERQVLEEESGTDEDATIET